MILSATGHRPDKIGGYILPNPIYLHVCREIERVLIKEKPEKVLSGMAQGSDQYFAMVAHKLGIPFVAVIPFENQESKWPEASQKTYRLLRKLAAEEIIVSSGGYASFKMQVRNEYLVDHCDKLVGIWNRDTFGGTYNCLQYAKSINREIVLINPNE